MAERDAGAQDPLSRIEVIPGTAGSGRLFDEPPMTPKPIECLGMTFPSDAAARLTSWSACGNCCRSCASGPTFPPARTTP